MKVSWMFSKSSARSAMFIAKTRRRYQVPLGAACPDRAPPPHHMPLLKELENSSVVPACYKHGARSGASAPPSDPEIYRRHTRLLMFGSWSFYEVWSLE